MTQGVHNEASDLCQMILCLDATGIQDGTPSCPHHTRVSWTQVRCSQSSTKYGSKQALLEQKGYFHEHRHSFARSDPAPAQTPVPSSLPAACLLLPAQGSTSAFASRCGTLPHCRSTQLICSPWPGTGSKPLGCGLASWLCCCSGSSMNYFRGTKLGSKRPWIQPASGDTAEAAGTRQCLHKWLHT